MKTKTRFFTTLFIITSLGVSSQAQAGWLSDFWKKNKPRFSTKRTWSCDAWIYVDGVHKYGGRQDFMKYYYQGGDRYITAGVGYSNKPSAFTGQPSGSGPTAGYVSNPSILDFSRDHNTGIPKNWRQSSSGFFSSTIDTAHRCKRTLRDTFMTHNQLGQFCHAGKSHITVLGVLGHGSRGVIGKINNLSDARRYHQVKTISCARTNSPWSPTHQLNSRTKVQTTGTRSSSTSRSRYNRSSTNVQSRNPNAYYQSLNRR